MRSIFFMYFLVLSALLFSCANAGKQNMLPNLAKADSAVIMYYNTPGNPRFFKYIKQYEAKDTEPLIKDINGKLITANNECITLGKIYFYGKKGVVDVVYFNNKEDCFTFSFIITGEKYFVKMSSASASLLNDWQSLAKEPIGTN